MIKIRKNCFETNSSSIHAICIDTKSLLNEEKIEFKFMNFGWEEKIYDSISAKACYLYTAIMGIGYKDEADERLKRLKKILDDNNIKYSFKAAETDSFEDNKKEYYTFDGYVDHCGELRQFIDELLSDENLLIKFLFGDSMIITGNDNCNIPFPYYILRGNGWMEDYKKTPVKEQYDHYDKIYYKGN